MKTPLLLLHGALGTKQQLIALKEILSEERETYSLEFEGHGDHRSDSDFSISLFKNNIKTFLNENNLRKIDIFGFSMGGYVALDFAFHNPSYVRKIITLGTKFDWSPDFAKNETKKLNPDLIEEKVPHFAKSLQQLHGESEWKNVVMKTAKFMEDLGSSPSLNKQRLQEIASPGLICVGELDNMTTIEESSMVAETLPKGKLQLLEDTKHPIEAISETKAAKIINDFLDKI